MAELTTDLEAVIPVTCVIELLTETIGVVAVFDIEDTTDVTFIGGGTTMLKVLADIAGADELRELT